MTKTEMQNIAKTREALNELIAIEEKFGDETFSKAIIAMHLYTEVQNIVMNDTFDEALIPEIAERIYRVYANTDEARFSTYDYADAIIYYPANIDFEKLLELNEDDFERVIIRMAEVKRATYSDEYAPDDEEAAKLIKSISI